MAESRDAMQRLETSQERKNGLQILNASELVEVVTRQKWPLSFEQKMLDDIASHVEALGDVCSIGEDSSLIKRLLGRSPR